MDCVSSESVTADHHSPTNLVAMSDSARNRGFRVEHYVRAPVTLDLDLSVPVTVSCVLFSPDLPAQAELRLDLSGSNERGNDQFKLCHGTVIKGGGGEVVVVLKNPMSWKRNAAPLTMSSVMVCRSFACGGVLQRAEVQLQECWLRASPALSCCRHLKLCISRWTGTRPVTLKWMEIWGILARKCSLEEAKLFQMKQSACDDTEQSSSLSKAAVLPIPQYFHSCDPHLNPVYHSHADPQSNHDFEYTKPSSILDSSGSCKEVEVGGSMRSESLCGEELQSHPAAGRSTPERLLDEITFEVMEMPMILPSGHSVDQSTLDRLAQADAACGRPPIDPFTGNLTLWH